MKENLQGKREHFQLQKPAEGKLDLNAIFGNANPVQLEIGSGRGEFLLARASADPQANFLGIDVKDKRIKSILRLLQQGVHDNVRVMRLLVDENFFTVVGGQVFER
ncbi:MAG: hypothetical protein JW784_02965, partial [Candidatus Cloacimonetes bacterium]|nr:hypothetical protein [Candidatus Cloacimonadota bacterium]